MSDCTCRGANPNCNRCSGSGVIGRLGAESDFDKTKCLRELDAIVARPSARIRRTREKGPPAATALPVEPVETVRPRPTLCPQCQCGVLPKHLERHLKERCPKRKLGDSGKKAAKSSPANLQLQNSRETDTKQKCARSVGATAQELFERKFIQGGLCSGR